MRRPISRVRSTTEASIMFMMPTPPPTSATLASAVDTPGRVGVKALFAGPSGTGKTMAARAVATALRLPLYRVDLASVVSKWVGETEKNLREALSAAESAGAVLLFDEGDALFGKRQGHNRTSREAHPHRTR
jgi:SpoVK/Ycf46/Vps4 family AAA+-type ATPase